MSLVIVILAGLWLCIGAWLSADGVRGALPRIRQEYGRESVPVLVFTFIVGCVWLPVPFFQALVGRR